MKALIPEDEGLNSNAKYIAIDMKKLKGIGEEDIESIKEYFKKYKDLAFQKAGCYLTRPTLSSRVMDKQQ